jgi:hypothetical protein
MAKRFSKKLLERVKKNTSQIFEKSVRSVLGLKDESLEDLQNSMDFLRNAKDYASIYPPEEVEEMIEAKEKVDALYLQTILSLQTWELEEIIFIHNHGEIRRMPKTIEAITSELARRSIFGDSFESDLIDQNGDVDETRATNSANSGKSRKKRSRSVKG